MKNKTIFTSTSFFPGILIFLLLICTPTIKQYFTIKTPYFSFIEQLPSMYNKMEIPVISLQDGHIRSNNNQPFTKKFKSQEGKGQFTLFIDTSESPDISLQSKIRSGAGGIIIYKEKIIIYDSKKQREQTIPLNQLPKKINFTLDDKFIENLSQKYKYTVLIFLTIIIGLFYLISKLFWFLVIGLFFSTKAQNAGGGNFSIALWSLLLPTTVQTLMPAQTPCCCFSCGVYYLLLFISAWYLQKQLTPVKIKDI